MAAARDDEDGLSWWNRLRAPARGEDEDMSLPPPPAPADDAFGLRSRVQALLRQPLFAASPPAEAPTLRKAGAALLASAGLFGAPAPPYTAAAQGKQGALGGDEPLPPSWKLPGRKGPPAIIGDGAAPGAGPMPAAPGPGNPPDIDPGAMPKSEPGVPRSSLVAPNAASPLDHPDARTGLALTAADALLRRGVAALAEVAGGDRARLRQVVDGAVAWLGNVLPPEYRASAAKSGEAALADAERQIVERARAARTRAAIGTLAGHRAEAEHAFAQALIGDDRAALAAARRDAVNAWSAERRARGDGEAEIDAGARALDARYRRAALQHRLAQLDEPGIARALEDDPDAKDDPAAARAAADAILRTRRADPARAGEATIERAIDARKRDGRIDTPADESAARYRLRLQAQAARGIPEDRRRLLTNDERTQIAAAYLRVEAQSGTAAADRWLDAKAQEAGPNAERLKAELATPQSPPVVADQARTGPPRPVAEPPGAGEDSTSPRDGDGARVEPAQQKDEPGAPPSPGGPARPPATERGEREDAITKEIAERNEALAPDDWQGRIGLIVEIAKREGFVPFVVRRRLWHQVTTTDQRVSTEERLASARAIAELQRLFPEDIQRRLNRGELAVIDEIVRLDHEGRTDPEQIVRQAERNVGYPDLKLIVGAIAGARGGRSVRARQSRPLTPEESAEKRRLARENNVAGNRAEGQLKQIVERDIERFNLAIGPKRLVRVEGDGGTIPDLPLRTNSDRIPVFVEVKKFGARHRNPQRRRLRALGAHFMEIDPDKGQIRAQVPPYEKWITYDEWLQQLGTLLGREPRR